MGSFDPAIGSLPRANGFAQDDSQRKPAGGAQIRVQ
jgi:hypothetical protein